MGSAATSTVGGHRDSRAFLSPWLVVFDLDGTLINSSLDLCLAVNAAMRHVGALELSHEVITGYIGDGAAMLIRKALDQSGAALPFRMQSGRVDDRFERAFIYFLDFYREHKLDNTHLYDGVTTALQAIRGAAPQLPMAVLTNKPERPSREICAALGIAPFFFANYGGNSFETKKPEPTGLLTLMQQARAACMKIGLDAAQLVPGKVVMVGDSPADVLTARRAGCLSLGCLYGLAPQSLRSAQPDRFCSSPSEWPEILGIQGC